MPLLLVAMPLLHVCTAGAAFLPQQCLVGILAAAARIAASAVHSAECCQRKESTPLRSHQHEVGRVRPSSASSDGSSPKSALSLDPIVEDLLG